VGTGAGLIFWTVLVLKVLMVPVLDTEINFSLNNLTPLCKLFVIQRYRCTSGCTGTDTGTDCDTGSVTCPGTESNKFNLFILFRTLHNNDTGAMTTRSVTCAGIIIGTGTDHDKFYTMLLPSNTGSVTCSGTESNKFNLFILFRTMHNNDTGAMTTRSVACAGIIIGTGTDQDKFYTVSIQDYNWTVRVFEAQLYHRCRHHCRYRY
jgi:hypothetical protein